VGTALVDMNDLIEEWKKMNADLERQLAAFDPPMRLRTLSNRRDATEESKEHVRRCILELAALLRRHGEA
jgi:hypothetical protein